MKVSLQSTALTMTSSLLLSPPMGTFPLSSMPVRKVANRNVSSPIESSSSTASTTPDNEEDSENDTLILSTPVSLQQNKIAIQEQLQKLKIRDQDVEDNEEEEDNEEKAPTPSVIIPNAEYQEYNKDVWSNLSPMVWSSNKGMEVRVEWDAKKDDPAVIVSNIAHRIAPWFVLQENRNHQDDDDEDEEQHHQKNEMKKSILTDLVDGFVKQLQVQPSPLLSSSQKNSLIEEDISKSMTMFMNLCESMIDNVVGYKIKVSAMHGKSSTRCPAWHTDHVPMRWIQTMLGPGCCYIDPVANNVKENMFISRIMDVRNGLTKSSEWKERQVTKSGVAISQTEPGQPVVFVGYAFGATKKQHLEDRLPVLHRSPLNVPTNQGRVLLTLDVIVGNNDCDSDNEDGKEIQSTICTKGCCGDGN